MYGTIHTLRQVCAYKFAKSRLTTVGFEPTPFRNSALSYRLRPLGHIVIDRTNVAKVLFLAVMNRPLRHRVGGAVLVRGWRENSSDATLDPRQKSERLHVD